MSQFGTAARTVLAKAYRLRPVKGVDIKFQEVSAWPGSGSWEGRDSALRLKGARDWKSPAPWTPAERSAIFNPLVGELLKALRAVPLADAHLLDFGCGNGGFYPVMRSEKHTARWSYEGAEVNVEMLEYCSKMYKDVRFGMVKEVLTRGKRYDVVLASSVAEYLENTESFLEDMRILARRYLVLSRVPTYERHPDQIVLQEVRWRGQIEEHPMRIFNREGLEKTFRRKGLGLIHRGRIWNAGHVNGTPETISRDNFVLSTS